MEAQEQPMETEVNFYLHPKQEAFLGCHKRYKAFIGGVGSGKTFSGCLQAIMLAHNHPHSIGTVVAPSYRMLKDATLRTFMEVLPPQMVATPYNKTEKEIGIWDCEGTISIIQFRSADDPESLRGPNLTWFWIDEAALCVYETWRIMIGRLRRGASQMGYITTTPKGMNWIYKLFVEENFPSRELIQCTTADNKENLPQEFIEDLLQSYAGQFLRQEFYGEFVAFEGLVYSQFSRMNHVVKPEDCPDSFAEIIVGVDVGYTNPTAMLVIGYDGDGRAWVIDEVYERQLTAPQLVAKAQELRDQWQVDKFVVDPSAPMIIEMLNQSGCNTEAAFNEIIAGIQEVSGRLIVLPDGRPRMYISLACPNTISEVMQYRYADEKEGKEQKDKPIKVNDHAMDALRYGVMAQRGFKYDTRGGFGKDDF